MRYKLVNRLINYLPKNYYSTYENRNVIKKLEERGILTSIFPNKNKDLEDLFSSGLQSVYCGFDPTALSLHVGNLLGIIVLIHHQRSGHTPIALIGSATALIGDPSGKTTTRPQLEPKDVIVNSKRIEQNIRQIFENHENYIWNSNNIKKNINLPKLKILNNINWYENVKLIDFLSKFGYHLRMSDLLSRKQIQTRLKVPEGLSFTEFSYQLLQAYDWLHLFEKYNCRLQVGGNDQTGNITTGYELIDKLKQKHKCFGLTLPLLTNKSGEKIGKSTGNAVWLDEKELSTYEFYQYFLNTSDQMVETYLKLFTFISYNEINDIMQKHKKAPQNYEAQKLLAEQITLLVRGEAGLNSAIKCTKAFFTEDLDILNSLTESEFSTIFKSAKLTHLPKREGMKVLEMALDAKLFQNIDDATRIINEGGFSINFKKIKDPAESLKPLEHILNNNITLIRVGKKNYHVIKWLN